MSPNEDIAADWTPPWRFTPQGLVLERDLTREEFRTLGVRIGRMVDGLTWAIGDWLVYGVAIGEFGERYELAHQITGKSYEALSQAYRVSEAFPIADRVKGMSWTNHREALRLSPARRVPFLQQAQREGWGKGTLVMKITAITSRGVERALNTGKPLSPRQLKTATWRRMKKDAVQCPHCGERFQVAIEQQRNADHSAAQEHHHQREGTSHDPQYDKSLA